MVCWRRTILNIATAVMLRDLIEEAVKNGARGIDDKLGFVGGNRQHRISVTHITPTSRITHH